MVDGPPQIMGLPTDLYEHLVEMPAVLWRLPHLFSSTFADLVREVSAETVDPVISEDFAFAGNGTWLALVGRKVGVSFRRGYSGAGRFRGGARFQFRALRHHTSEACRSPQPEDCHTVPWLFS